MDKNRLLRLVCDDEGKWWPDLRQKAPGRGKYLCLEQECLHRLNDRYTQRLFPGCDRQALLHCALDAITHRVMELMHRLRGRSFLGKDAVMQALWQKSPLMVVLAEDASDGLIDRIEQAVKKHCMQQSTTQLVRAGAMAEFGAMYDRDRIAVIAWNRDPLTERLIGLMRWKQQLVGVVE